jgi:amino acid transporter
MALSLALSVIAATLTNIVLTSRIIYGMASYRTLPGFLATVSRRFATPVAASIIVGLLLIALTWVYLLANSVQNAFTAVIDVSGLLFGSFYILTALATVVYYRRRVVTSFWDALILGILPVAAAGFLGLIIYKSLLVAPASQIWSLVGVAVLGVLLMFAARFILKSPFFHIQRESDGQPADRPRAGSHRR